MRRAICFRFGARLLGVRLLGAQLFIALPMFAPACRRGSEGDVASVSGRDPKGDHDPDAGASGISLEAFCRALRAAWVEDCERRGGAACADQAGDGFAGEVCARAERAIEWGRVRYDGERAEACVDGRAFDLVSAWQVGWIPPLVCDGIFVGTARLGEACYPDETFQRVCAEGYCDATGACPGVCKPHAREGEACAPVRCEPGLFCDGENRCRPELEAGSACPERGGCALPARCVDGVCVDAAAYDEHCDSETPCEYPWYCSRGTCTNEVGEGDSCDTHERCPAELGCVFDPPGGTVQVCTDRPEAGQACDRRSGCVSGFTCASDGSPYRGACEPGWTPDAGEGSLDPEPDPVRTRCWGE